MVKLFKDIIAPALGGAAGAYFGGPAGAMAGAQLAGSLTGSKFIGGRSGSGRSGSGGGGSFFSGGGGETVSAQPLAPAFQLKSGQALSNFVQKFLPLFKPGEKFGGELTAPLTRLENLGLKELGGVLEGSPTGELFGAAKGQILDTLGGKFADPAESPFIQAMVNLANQNLEDEITATRARRGARNTFFTRAGITEESRLSERTQNVLNSLIGRFIEGERGRQFSAVPVAQALDEFENLDAPLRRVAASQTLGSLNRTVKQADLERGYQEFLRQRGEVAGVVPTAVASAGQNIPFGFPNLTAPVDPSAGSSIQKILGTLNRAGAGGGFDIGSLVNNISNIFGRGTVKTSHGINIPGGAVTGGRSSAFMRSIGDLLPIIAAAV